VLIVLTGAEAAVGPVASRLEGEGVEVVPVTDTQDVDRLERAIGGRTVDGYVQLPSLLPVDSDGSRGSLVAQVGQFLADGLLARFYLADVVLAHLAAEATVVLVGGNTPVQGRAVDDQDARLSLLRVLGHAMRAASAESRLKVRVLAHGTDPGEVADVALGRRKPEPRPSAQAPAGDSDVDLSYADWRTQLLGLATVEF
jgi:hypothetical protein